MRNAVPKYINPNNVRKLIGGVTPFGVKHLVEALDFALHGFDRGANMGSIFPPNPNTEANSGNHTLRIASMGHSPLWTSDYGFDGKKGIVTSMMRIAKRFNGANYQGNSSDKGFVAIDSSFDIVMNLRLLA